MRKVMAMAAVAAFCAPTLLSAQSWRDVTMSRQLQNNDEVHVSVEYGAGELFLRSVDDGLLYRMNLHYDEDIFEPVADVSGDRVHLGIESIGRNSRVRGGDHGELDLELARGVPMDLSLEFGAVKAELDLGGLALTDLDLRTGASESTVDISEPNSARIERASFDVGAAEFTVNSLGNLNAEEIEVNAGVGAISLGLDGRWQRDAHLSIDMGVGKLEILVPEGLGVELRKESFLTALDSEGLVKRGDVYRSVDWDDADRRVTIDLNAAFGAVDIRWIR